MMLMVSPAGNIEEKRVDVDLSSGTSGETTLNKSNPEDILSLRVRYFYPKCLVGHPQLSFPRIDHFVTHLRRDLLKVRSSTQTQVVLNSGSEEFKDDSTTPVNTGNTYRYPFQTLNSESIENISLDVRYQNNELNLIFFPHPNFKPPVYDADLVNAEADDVFPHLFGCNCFFLDLSFLGDMLQPNRCGNTSSYDSEEEILQSESLQRTYFLASLVAASFLIQYRIMEGWLLHGLVLYLADYLEFLALYSSNTGSEINSNHGHENINLSTLLNPRSPPLSVQERLLNRFNKYFRDSGQMPIEMSLNNMTLVLGTSSVETSTSTSNFQVTTTRQKAALIVHEMFRVYNNGLLELPELFSELSSRCYEGFDWDYWDEVTKQKNLKSRKREFKRKSDATSDSKLRCQDNSESKQLINLSSKSTVTTSVAVTNLDSDDHDDNDNDINDGSPSSSVVSSSVSNIDEKSKSNINSGPAATTVAVSYNAYNRIQFCGPVLNNTSLHEFLKKKIARVGVIDSVDNSDSELTDDVNLLDDDDNIQGHGNHDYTPPELFFRMWIHGQSCPFVEVVWEVNKIDNNSTLKSPRKDNNVNNTQGKKESLLNDRVDKDSDDDQVDSTNNLNHQTLIVKDDITHTFIVRQSPAFRVKSKDMIKASMSREGKLFAQMDFVENPEKHSALGSSHSSSSTSNQLSKYAAAAGWKPTDPNRWLYWAGVVTIEVCNKYGEPLTEIRFDFNGEQTSVDRIEKSITANSKTGLSNIANLSDSTNNEFNRDKSSNTNIKDVDRHQPSFIVLKDCWLPAKIAVYQNIVQWKRNIQYAPDLRNQILGCRFLGGSTSHKFKEAMRDILLMGSGGGGSGSGGGGGSGGRIIPRATLLECIRQLGAVGREYLCDYVEDYLKKYELKRSQKLESHPGGSQFELDSQSQAPAFSDNFLAFYALRTLLRAEKKQSGELLRNKNTLERKLKEKEVENFGHSSKKSKSKNLKFTPENEPEVRKVLRLLTTLKSLATQGLIHEVVLAAIFPYLCVLQSVCNRGSVVENEHLRLDIQYESSAEWKKWLSWISAFSDDSRVDNDINHNVSDHVGGNTTSSICNSITPYSDSRRQTIQILGVQAQYRPVGKLEDILTLEISESVPLYERKHRDLVEKVMKGNSLEINSSESEETMEFKVEPLEKLISLKRRGNTNSLSDIETPSPKRRKILQAQDQQQAHYLVGFRHSKLLRLFTMSLLRESHKKEPYFLPANENQLIQNATLATLEHTNDVNKAKMELNKAAAAAAASQAAAGGTGGTGNSSDVVPAHAKLLTSLMLKNSSRRIWSALYDTPQKTVRALDFVSFRKHLMLGSGSSDNGGLLRTAINRFGTPPFVSQMGYRLENGFYLAEPEKSLSSNTSKFNDDYFRSYYSPIEKNSSLAPLDLSVIKPLICTEATERSAHIIRTYTSTNSSGSSTHTHVSASSSSNSLGLFHPFLGRSYVFFSPVLEQLRKKTFPSFGRQAVRAITCGIARPPPLGRDGAGSLTTNDLTLGLGTSSDQSNIGNPALNNNVATGPIDIHFLNLHWNWKDNGLKMLKLLKKTFNNNGNFKWLETPIKVFFFASINDKSNLSSSNNTQAAQAKLEFDHYLNDLKVQNQLPILMDLSTVKKKLQNSTVNSTVGAGSGTHPTTTTNPVVDLIGFSSLKEFEDTVWQILSNFEHRPPITREKYKEYKKYKEDINNNNKSDLLKGSLGSESSTVFNELPDVSKIQSFWKLEWGRLQREAMVDLKARELDAGKGNIGSTSVNVRRFGLVEKSKDERED